MWAWESAGASRSHRKMRVCAFFYCSDGFFCGWVFWSLRNNALRKKKSPRIGVTVSCGWLNWWHWPGITKVYASHCLQGPQYSQPCLVWSLFKEDEVVPKAANTAGSFEVHHILNGSKVFFSHPSRSGRASPFGCEACRRHTAVLRSECFSLKAGSMKYCLNLRYK